MVLADPRRLGAGAYVETGKIGEAGSWVVEGIGEDFIPPIADLSRVKKAYSISDKESLTTARELLQPEWILGGSSAGTLVAAALRYCREQSAPKRVVTFVSDTGSKYLSKMYNDFWMVDQGFLELPRYGDLRDLVSRRYEDRAVIAASADDTLLAAFQRMRMADVSQLPVLADDRGRRHPRRIRPAAARLQAARAIPRQGCDGDDAATRDLEAGRELRRIAGGAQPRLRRDHRARGPFLRSDHPL